MIFKKYSKFLEELKVTRELTTSEAFSEFIELIEGCADKIDSDGAFDKSYRSCAQQGRNYDPDRDFDEINEYMSMNGYNLDTINQLAEDYDRNSFNNRIENINPSRCGAVDYYLYKITNGSFPLAGYRLDKDDIHEEKGADSEYFIKFSYGWHNTKYGKLYIEQNMKMEEFTTKVKEQIPFYILDKLMDSSIVDGNINYKIWYNDFVYTDRSIYFNTEDLYKTCEKNLKGKVEYDKFHEDIIRIVDEFKEIVGEINITKIRDEIRISI